MGKHLVDIDDEVLERARAALHTATIKETVNTALRRSASEAPGRLREALDTLAAIPLSDRETSWR